jgi:hypothetical protein
MLYYLNICFIIQNNILNKIISSIETLILIIYRIYPINKIKMLVNANIILQQFLTTKVLTTKVLITKVLTTNIIIYTTWPIMTSLITIAVIS